MPSPLHADWLAALGLTALHFLLQGTLVATALEITLRLVGDRPRARYAAACGALAALCAYPAVTLATLLGTGPDDATASPAGIPLVTLVAHLGSLSPLGANAFPEDGSRAAALLGRFHGTLPYFGCVWLAGALVLSLRLAGGVAASRRLRRGGVLAAPDLQRLLLALSQTLGVRTPVRLLQSVHVDVPVVIGWLKPVVLLPVSAVTGLRADQLELILAHELAHIRRHDPLVNLAQAVAETLLFFHPAVWWVSSEVRAAREGCCDDLVVAACGDARRYARVLATLEGLRRPPPGALAASDGPLLGRVRRLLSRETGEARPPRAPGIWAAGLLVVLGLGAIHRPALTPAQAGAGPTRFEGVVRWHDLPLPGTRVELYRLAPGERACCAAGQLAGTAVTGADGAYAFSGIAAGIYAVVAAPPDGYQPQGYYDLPVFTNATATHDIFVAKPLEVPGPRPDGPANTPPTLRWRPVPDTARYAVRLTDLEAGPDAPRVFRFADQARLTLDRPLAADTTYLLQVSAYAADGTEIAANDGTTFHTGQNLTAAYFVPVLPLSRISETRQMAAEFLTGNQPNQG